MSADEEAERGQPPADQLAEELVVQPGRDDAPEHEGVGSEERNDYEEEDEDRLDEERSKLKEKFPDFNSTTPPGSPVVPKASAVGHQLRLLLSQYTVSQVVSPRRRLILLEAHDTIDHCLMTLQDNGITAVPIVDLQQRKYLGMVSALDLAAYVASLFPQSEELPDKLPNAELESIVNISKMNPFLPQPLSSSLPAVMKIFIQGVHRLPLQDEKGNICALVTQTDVLRFLMDHYNDFVGTEHRSSLILPSVSEIGLTKRPIQKIPASNSVVSVIDNLYKVSALALVDEEGRLVGDMSAECLRILSIHNFKRIYLPAEHIGDRGCVRVEPDAQLDEVINAILDAGKHRAWVVDGEDRPRSLITMTDIIRKLLSL